jgi:hypothetical protein
MRTLLKKIALNNFTLALIVSLPFWFIAGRYISKYTSELSGPLSMNCLYKYMVYNDLDNNGTSDLVYFGENQLGNVYAKVFDPAHRGQFNTTGNFIKNVPLVPFFADINEDGINEILFITAKDSARIFLNIINYMEDDVQEFEICQVGVPGKRDISCAITHYTDLNRDGGKEIIFFISGGYALQPRSIYSLNPHTGELKRTPEQGSKLVPHILADIDNDGYSEIVCGTFTYQNYSDTASIPYDDNHSRLFIFDHNLEFKVSPLEFSKIRSYARPALIKEDGEAFIYVFLEKQGDLRQPDKHYTIGADGAISKEKELPSGFSDYNIRHQMVEFGGTIYLLDYFGNLYRVKPGLERHRLKRFPQFAHCFFRVIDINNDGHPKFIFNDRVTGKLSLVDHHLKHPVSAAQSISNIRWVSPRLDGNGQNSYLLHNENGHYLLTWYLNPLWAWRFLFYAGIFGFFLALFVFMNRVQAFKLKEKLRVEKQMHELQYRVITSRFSPHYTFNVLNTISSHISTQENPALYNYFSKFIRQLRYLYDDKNAVTRSLKEEIDFCRDYLDIQKMRFGEKFDYHVNIDEEVNTALQIPKMMLHIFVENAFKHGLRPYEKGGLITLDATTENGKTTIAITDNGIGREAARAYCCENPHYTTGRGLQMLHEFIALYNKGKNEQIEILMEDLEEAGNAAGTKVIVRIQSHIE